MQSIKFRSILVLEAGGFCGFSIIKLLRKIKGVRVVAADMDQFSCGFQLADVSYQIPPISADNYLYCVEKILKQENIDAVFPTFERGCEKLINLSSNFLIDLNNSIKMQDKWNFVSICNDKGLDIPETYLYSDRIIPPTFPVYIRPRFGAGSKNNYSISNQDQYISLRNFLPKGMDFLVQPLIEASHWNVDVLVDEGVFISAVPRKDIKMMFGNPFTVEVKNYDPLINFSKKVQGLLEINFPFNLEVFETKPGTFTMIEINVRFGGGVTFSAMAGVDEVAYLATKDSTYIGNILEGVYTRYFDELSIKKNPIVMV